MNYMNVTLSVLFLLVGSLLYLYGSRVPYTAKYKWFIRGVCWVFGLLTALTGVVYGGYAIRNSFLWGTWMRHLPVICFVLIFTAPTVLMQLKISNRRSTR